MVSAGNNKIKECYEMTEKTNVAALKVTDENNKLIIETFGVGSQCYLGCYEEK